jgi:hypothetical protein
LLILKSRNATTAWCSHCGAEVEVIVISSDEISSIMPWLDMRAVHLSETADGSTRLCLNSLLSHAHTTSARRALPRLGNSEKERI